MCPILACQIEMGQLILSPLNLGLKFIRSSLLFFRSSNLDRNYTTNSPGSPACRLHPIGFLSFYYHVSQCFIINVSQLIDRWEIGAVFFWRTLIYRLKSVLKIWENNPCISLLLPFFSCFAMLCLATWSCLTLCNPMESSPQDSYLHGDSPGKNTGVGCHALLQGIFPTRNRTRVSHTADRFFTIWATREAWWLFSTKGFIPLVGSGVGNGAERQKEALEKKKRKYGPRLGKLTKV